MKRNGLIYLLIALASCTGLVAQEEITLEDIWVNGTFRQKFPSGIRSMEDGIHYTLLENKDGVQELNKYGYKNGKKAATLLKSSDLGEGITIDDYLLSTKEDKVLIKTNQESIYRHSTRENVLIYDLNSKKVKAIQKDTKVMHPTFSPDGSMLAYVKDNNIYYTDLATDAEVQVTTDGKVNEIINGSSDWVYEEEFKLVRAYEWSPDGKKIAFLRFDERKVKEYSMPIYDGLYPSQYKFKYPKAGEKNSDVTCWVYHLQSKETLQIAVTDFEYIPRIQWTNDANQLAVVKLNRLQSYLYILYGDASTGETHEVYQDVSDSYVEIKGDILFLDDGRFFWQSEASGYNHIYLINPIDGANEQITENDVEILEFYGYSKERNRIYFLQSQTLQPQITYLVSWDPITREITELSRDHVYHTAKFSKGMKYYIDYTSTLNTPTKITVNDPEDGKVLRVMEDNAELAEKMTEYGFSKFEMAECATDGVDMMYGWMLKPADFDPKKKYPVLVYVYGGPGSQTAANRWGGYNAAWYQMLAQKGYIVVSFDNRGTGARGRDFRISTYKQLGNLESRDQISVAKWLRQQPFVDKERIGIWGWSYGGYMTTLCMTKGADYFKTGIAVAPVTNWKFYDSIYTERYMSTPDENESGYEENSPINHVDKLKGNFLVIHGTADDNVHFQNTTELVEAMTEAGKQFDMAIYTNKNHSISGGKTRLHLYKRMTNYLLENL